MYLDNKRVLITGGTGSLGKVLTRRILSCQMGTPQSVVVFSRDEAKQHEMRMEYLNRRSVTEDVMYHNFERTLQFKIGDVRDFHSVAQALINVDIVFNAAALKQVPACEYFPYEAVRTNIEGAENIVRAIKELRLNIETVVAISTDKACKPTNVMGMTKAIQERIFLTANIDCPKTRFVAVRYGNVLASRGSVVPLFLDQIEAGGPITITDKNMTRFLLTLDQAVDTVFEAMQFAEAGDALKRSLSHEVRGSSRATWRHRLGVVDRCRVLTLSSPRARRVLTASSPHARRVLTASSPHARRAGNRDVRQS